MYRATVKRNDDPLSKQRLILRIPQVLGEADSEWAETSDPTNSVPRLGDTIWVQFSGGDVTKPIYIANGLSALNILIDRKVTYSTDPPGSTPNSVGDVWWQKNDTGQIIGQWEGMGGVTWVPRQLSHEIVYSIDAATITVGQLQGDQLAADSIDGKTITGALIQTSHSANLGVKSDNSGIKAWSPSGAQTFNLDATTGDTTIGGNAAITGTLSLPAGIVDNAALSSPVKPVWSHADSGAGSFSVTTTMTARATATVTVPTGYTQALVFAVGQASAVNTTGSLDTVYVSVIINGVEPPGWASGQDVGPSGFGGATSAVSQLLTGLTGGGTFPISVRIMSAFAGWSANASNEANIDSSVLFLR